MSMLSSHTIDDDECISHTIHYISENNTIVCMYVTYIECME